MKTTGLFIPLLALLPLTLQSKTFKAGDWIISADTKDGAVTIVSGNDTIINRSIAEWGNGTHTTSFAHCKKIKFSKVKDSGQMTAGIFPSAEVFALTGEAGKDTKATLWVSFPEEGRRFVTGLVVAGGEAREGLDYLAPINSSAPVTLAGSDNRQLSVPYDNDAWVRYGVTPFGREARESYEAGALFDAVSRKGVVAGSIDHDLWKSAVRYATSGKETLDSLTLYSGASSALTRDVRRHGLVKGESVASARFVVDVTPDWRDGMEAFADLCAQVSPNRTKGGARPFGWNSWGDLQTKINFKNACEVSDFIRDNLAHSFVGADSTVVIDLDAFWDFGFKEDEHRKFVEHCKANGQRPAIYYCPFTDWGKNPEAVVNEAPGYKMGDLYLRHDGKPIEFDGAPALDPTHPATRARIERQLNQFKEWGYEYVKIDFMAHGAYESDIHYDPSVMTGTRAFCKGMEFIDSVADGKLWLNLSIAPLFPACYAQSRRIGCDAWSNIGSTEYTLNALTYGWWLDHLYHYNDADHIVFKGVTEGENRARLLSSAITGVYFLGDDMSETGDSLTMERIKRFATVDGINRMARSTKSFRPLRPGNGESASDIFEGRAGKSVWVAAFNYGDDQKQMMFSFDELGISPDKVKVVTELWSGQKLSLSDDAKVRFIIPSKDAMVFEIVTE